MAEFKVAEFGEMLRDIRGNRSQQEVETESGVDQHTLSNLERGQTKSPSFVTICKLADYYGLTPNDMGAMAGLFAPAGAEEDMFAPDVSRELQRVWQLMLELETPSKQRAFAKRLGDVVAETQRQRERDELITSSRLPDYIRRKLASELSQE